MRYATAPAFRTALEARLLAHSQATGLSLNRLRKQVVFERILARLLVVAPDRWILKGGFALDLRLGTHARPTKDVDLSRHDDVEHATADMVAAQSTDVGDYFQFVVERTEALDDLLEGAAVRYRVNACLAGRRFEQVVVDIGFGDPFLQGPDMLSGTGLLEFADVAQRGNCSRNQRKNCLYSSCRNCGSCRCGRGWTESNTNRRADYGRDADDHRDLSQGRGVFL